MADPSKAQQRAEIERLTQDYDEPITRRRRDIRTTVVCPVCHSERMTSSLAYVVACRRCQTPMVAWWTRPRVG
jgi:hypothetical protein